LEARIGASRGTHLDGVGGRIVGEVGEGTRARISVAACIGHVASVDSLVGRARGRVIGRVGVWVVHVGLDARVTDIKRSYAITIEVVLEKTSLTSSRGHHTTTIVAHGNQIDSITVA
jgi:hypothetical protein